MKLSKKYTYTVLPAAWYEKVNALLESDDRIDFEYMSEADLPDDVPARCIFRGREITHPIMCVRSNLILEELRQAVEHGTTKAEIEN
ncbi:MAG: hypothetical protein J5966_05760 [Lachnospiraceae bacterium]|nr:hypothetical protein [Lachnospiraceae bacterium]